MKTGQDYIKNGSGADNCGFNNRIHGEKYNDVFRYPHNYDMIGGWNLADKMIEEGRIYFLHNFHHSHSDCKGYAFTYGGFWVCNTCGAKGVDEPWWTVKVMKDGNAWCCIGEDFVNLQESDNVAFGDTREDAISNYGDLFTVIERREQ